MKTERSDIEFPLWRKKVDATLFKDAATPIPKWTCKIWEIEKLFSKCSSRDNLNSIVKIYFDKKQFEGRVHTSKPNGMYRLFFAKELSDILKDVFLMSYMRSIEQNLRKNNRDYSKQEIENEIPFWEFLDIEFDSSKKIFYFKAYYIQKPTYIELFKELVKSHTLKIIDDLLNTKDEFRFVKQDWEPRTKLKTQIDAKNVIYNLIDTTNKKIYIGEAVSLVQRLNQNREVIKHWDYYRFDCLPKGLTRPQRIAIERLLIRTFASFLNNKKGIPSMKISEYDLANEKIDS
jgi:hypothetical protein